MTEMYFYAHLRTSDTSLSVVKNVSLAFTARDCVCEVARARAHTQRQSVAGR